jgi:hypothetical protein
MGVTHQQIVVDTAVFREDFVGVFIIGGDADVIWAGDVFEILHPPRIALNNRHRVPPFRSKIFPGDSPS